MRGAERRAGPLGKGRGGGLVFEVDGRRRRWVMGGFIVYGAIVAVVLLAPVSYSGIVNRIGTWAADAWGLDWFGSGWIEFVANIVVFVPLGFLMTLLLRRRVTAFVIAIGISVSAELIQAVIPSRQPSLRDVLANALGAALGALIAWVVLRLTRGRPSAPTLDQAGEGVAEL